MTICMKRTRPYTHVNVAGVEYEVRENGTVDVREAHVLHFKSLGFVAAADAPKEVIEVSDEDESVADNPATTEVHRPRGRPRKTVEES